MTTTSTAPVTCATQDPMLPQFAEVLRKRRETHDTFTLELAPRGQRWPFAPGQYNMLYVPGVGEVPISISGDPDRDGVLVHTTREVGAVTRAMRALEPGDMIGLRGPYGTAWPMAEGIGHDVLVIAGGIGLAPLRPALYQMLSRRHSYQRIVLLHGARTPTDILFRKELADWRGRFDLDVFVTVDRATGSWRGNVGVITDMIPKAPLSAANAIALICGPEVMIKYAARALRQRGIGLDQIYCSMERNMKCGVGLCGHCQYGPHFVCRDGAVFRYDTIEPLLSLSEI